jgi:hypothetical protein
MTSSPSRGSRNSRLLWWLLGIPAAAALIVSLLVVLKPIVLLQNASNHVDDVERRDAEQYHRSALTAQDRLRAAAADGELTDFEIADAAGRLWSVQRTAQHLRVVTGYPAEPASPGCYAVDLPLPLGPATKGTLTVATPCPTGPAVAPTSP